MCSCSGVDCSRYITSAPPLIHFLTAVRLLLNINGKFGWSRRGCRYFCEVLVKLAFHSKCFCLHSGIFIPSRFPVVCGAVASQGGCSLLWMWRCGAVARNDNQHSDPFYCASLPLISCVASRLPHSGFISFISSNSRSLRSTIQVFNAHILLLIFPAVSKSTVTS